MTASAPFTLFVRPRDPQKEQWTGVRGGVEAAREQFCADAAWPVSDLAEKLGRALSDVDTVYARLDARPSGTGCNSGTVRGRWRRGRARTGHGPLRLVDPGLLLNELRLRKDDGELTAMRAAARISVESFAEAVRVVRDGAGEWQVEAALENGFRRRGASGPAFPSIVAGGANATVLHYVANDQPLRAADGVLLDAGARAAMYCADITRVFPVSGRWQGAWRAVYDIVLGAHGAGIAAVRPGASIRDVHDAAQRELVRGMVELGLVRGDVDTLVAEDREISQWYPHRTSHWLGLDVHDAGDYVQSDAPRVLEPGMVFTVEPGLYIRGAHGSTGGPARYSCAYRGRCAGHGRRGRSADRRAAGAAGCGGSTR